MPSQSFGSLFGKIAGQRSCFSIHYLCLRLQIACSWLWYTCFHNVEFPEAIAVRSISSARYLPFGYNLLVNYTSCGQFLNLGIRSQVFFHTRVVISSFYFDFYLMNIKMKLIEVRYLILSFLLCTTPINPVFSLHKLVVN